ncbi:MAG: preprotein translocase subunit SecY, preprotein translocase subunit SecY [Candidatus Taylorbacteria bacterium]|nr:preprotein translocase subunit SecY, preprotein translocase subunit SecY [Candidatus Taylorbacteria bacterium]
MKTFFEKIAVVLKDPSMRKRIIFALGALVVFRLLATIPIPGIDTLALQRLLSGNQFFGLLDIFSGGGISKLSIMMLGVGPYITASIIMQLLTMMVPSMKAMMQEDGEAGRQKLSQYSRLLSVPLAMLQSFGFLTLLVSQHVLSPLTPMMMLVNVVVVTGGSVLLMWIGELISEFGIGNGVSLIIFAGIVAVLPTRIIQFAAQFTVTDLPYYILFLAVAAIVIAGVVVVTEAERPVPVTYAKQVRGNKVYGGVSTYLPLRLNQAGVIPIIFALSILLFPQIVANFLKTSANTMVADIATRASDFLGDQVVHAILYFFLVFIFTYFYTAITFDPKQISENLQKGGAFIPGVRPGESTMNYLGKIVTRITLVGALFLGIVAVLPLIVQGITGTTTLAIGGTALLIVVSVVLDLLKKIDAQATMREY